MPGVGVGIGVGFGGGRRAPAPTAAEITFPTAANVLVVGATYEITATITGAYPSTHATFRVNGTDVGAMTIVAGVATYSWTPDAADASADLTVRAYTGAGEAVSDAVTVEVQAWDAWWHADAGVTLTGADVTEWAPVVGAASFVPGNAPNIDTSFNADATRDGVQFVSGSSENLQANALAPLFEGDDTEFCGALHLTQEAATAGTFFSLGLSSDATKYWRVYASGGTTVNVQGRGTGDGANVTSGAGPAIATNTECVVTFSRTAGTTRVGVHVAGDSHTYADLAHAIGSLPDLDRIAIGAQVRNATATPHDCTFRNVFLAAGTSTDAKFNALANAILGA